jgi:uncharacterized protein
MPRDRGTLTLRREDGRVVCESVVVADRTLRRLRGLLGRKNLRPDQGILLRPAWSIHTAFMRFAIDVIFLDHDQTVLRIDPGLKPFRTASCRGAREVVELAAGECARRGLEVGDRVAWAPRGRFDEGPTSENVLESIGSLGNAVVASDEQRFSKLARFLLEGQNVSVIDTVSPDDAVASLDQSVQVVLLDVAPGLAEGLRRANALRSLRPDVHIVLAGETAAGEASFTAARIYDRWNETAEIVDAVVEVLEERRKSGSLSLGSSA